MIRDPVSRAKNDGNIKGVDRDFFAEVDAWGKLKIKADILAMPIFQRGN